MIQNILFASLGFLCAGLLALIAAPALWRRAAALERKRMEATLPLSFDEMQAEKDRVRADFAMSVRRLEMNVESLKEKSASQRIEIDRARQELRDAAGECDRLNVALTGLQQEAADLRAQLSWHDEERRGLSEQIAKADALLEEKQAEIERLEGLYEEASLVSSSRDVEIANRDTEMERQRDEIRNEREKRKEAEAEARQAKAEQKDFADALRTERKRVTELQSKIEAMAVAPAAPEPSEAGDEGPRERARTLAAASEQKRLQSRLTALVRENKKLRRQIESGDADGGRPREGELQLREQLIELAAEVVSLTAAIEGPDSPVDKAIAAAGEPAREGEPASLAERIRALRNASAAAG